MSLYQYTAKDKTGQSVSGSLESNSDTEVADLLHKKEMVVISIELAKNASANAKSKDK